jgi:hypothetical protein
MVDNQDMEAQEEVQTDFAVEIRKKISTDLKANQRKLRFLSLAPLYLFVAQFFWLMFDSGRPASQAARGDHLVLAFFLLAIAGLYMLIAPGWLYRRMMVGTAWEYDVKGLEGLWAVFATALSPGVLVSVFGFFYYFLTLNYWLANLFYLMGFLYILKQLLWKDHLIDTAALEIARFVDYRRIQNQPFLLNQNNIDEATNNINNQTSK